MRVDELMTRHVQVCGMHDNAHRAAELMWRFDVGCLPVVDVDHRITGVVTDRDICMAAYTQGRPLCEIPIGHCMSVNVHTVHMNDSLQRAEKIMQDRQVHRLPVVDAAQQLVGMISLNDIVLASRRQFKDPALRIENVAATFGAICEHRLPAAAAHP